MYTMLSFPAGSTRLGGADDPGMSSMRGRVIGQRKFRGKIGMGFVLHKLLAGRCVRE